MHCRGATRLMIVEDEIELRGMIAEGLLRDGYTVDEAGSGAELDAALDDCAADLILLDIGLPGEDGLSIARRIKAAGNTPIIILSALGDCVDRIVGLEVGADDYVVKPFDMHELRARIRAVLRRGTTPELGPAMSDPQTGDFVCFGSAMLSLSERTLTSRDGDVVALTPCEFALVETFLQNPGRVLSRERLASVPGMDSSHAPDRAIDIRMTRLRKKLEDDPRKPCHIRTVRGAGYIYVPTARP